MDKKQLWRDIVTHARSLFPLFRYLILQTETHAFCLALACAALIGFYPFCALMLSLMQHQFHWDGGYKVIMLALQVLYPNPEFLVRNLDVTVRSSGRSFELGSVIWVFLGAAGVFIPLEAGLNRLWKVHEDRPYWQNQLFGIGLTLVCCVLAITFVVIIATLRFPGTLLLQVSETFQPVTSVSDTIILHLMAVVFFSMTIFVLYKFLPNRKIDTFQVLPAAILAGVVAEIVKDVYVLLLPFMDIRGPNGSQGPFYISVSFVILAYFETFVVLGGAFLATQTEAYPWMGFIRHIREARHDQPSST
jgi:uncharacterized BrkB/YihY/UPF0761 family membrane protein